MNETKFKKKISVIGGGAAALFFCCFIDTNRYDVTIFEKTKSVGRKFLVAGNGGFNLTHGDDISEFISRYLPTDFMDPFLKNYTNKDLISFLDNIGIPTFVGSSGRVFPQKGIKPISVLKALLHVLEQRGISIQTSSQWNGVDENGMLLINDTAIESDVIIFAMGGASWQKTGSDGTWKIIFDNLGINTSDFIASNCGFHVDWSSQILEDHVGKPLKNIHLRYKNHLAKGELVITDYGIEGNAIYALSPYLQNELLDDKKPIIEIDLKPHLSRKVILQKHKNSKAKNNSQFLKQDLKFTPQMLAILKSLTTKQIFQDIEKLTFSIKSLPIIIEDSAPIDEAISTMGGVSVSALDSNLQLKNLPHHYCIGEMIEWNAPTGGYLLQGCISMGIYVARQLNASQV